MRFWTEEKVKLLRELWPVYPHSYVASQLGCTKNAAMGKANRIGLCAEVSGLRKQAIPQSAPSIEPAQGEVDDLAIPEAQRKTLLQLTDRTCHWPVGDPKLPGFFFCGAEADVEHVYCRPHRLRAIAPRAFLGAHS